MSNNLSERDQMKVFLRKQLWLCWRQKEPSKDFRSIEAWEYISTYLCGENGQRSCCHFLRGETQALARLGTLQVRVGKQGSKELLSLLCNIEPNVGDKKLDNPGLEVFDSGILPQMERFHGPVEKGYAFLQSYKTQTGSFFRWQMDANLCCVVKVEALSWYLGTVISLWKELEEELI